MKRKVVITSICFLGMLGILYIFKSITFAQDNLQILPDGVYEIETGVDSNKVVEVIDASKVGGANVQIFARNTEADCQKVNLKYVGDGYYTISFVHSGMMLDVYYALTDDGTNVWQCWSNGADAQKWKITQTSDGYFNLVSKCNNKFLTVANGRTSNCTNIEINSDKNNISQKFKLNRLDGEEDNSGERTIEDGIYQIETGVDTNKVIEVINASTVGGANVQIFAKNSKADCQKVNVKYVGDGYYTISFVHSGMLLDVYYACTDDGTNVWQCGANGSDAQKWRIKETQDGYFNIVSKLKNKYLTVKNGGTANCTNIEICSNKNNLSQKFKMNRLDVVDNIVKEKTIEDGVYQIETIPDNSKVIEVVNSSLVGGANVQINAKQTNLDSQRVNVKYIGDGYYTISFVHSGMMLDVFYALTDDRTNVWQCGANGADAQKWVIQQTSDGYYNIVSKLENKYLTVENGKTANGTNIEINSKKSNNSQKFKFNKIELPDEPVREKTIEDGIYRIQTGVDSSKVLEVINASKLGGSNVQIFSKNEKANCQKVNVKYVGDGYYTISFVHSDMMLDVYYGLTEDGTNVWQCGANGADAQKWVIQKTPDGYYNIISKLEDKYLTVANGNTTNCTNIEINSKKNNLSQKFKFVPVSSSIEIEDGLYEIETAVNGNKALDVVGANKAGGANVQVYDKNQTSCQKVIVSKGSDGYYTFKFLHSEMMLDIYYGVTDPHTNVWQAYENYSDAQKWEIVDSGDGYYNIVAKSSSSNGKMYLTVGNPNVEIDVERKDESQMFKFNKLNELYGTRTISDGLYEVETALDSNKLLEVIDASKVSGANVQIFARNIQANCQKVDVKYVGEGFYTLTFLHSKMLLDVSNGNTADRTNVWQCKDNGSDAQKWLIKDLGNGNYNIISKSANKYLTVANSGTANCTNIEINSYKNNNSQVFRFVETSPYYTINIDDTKYPGYAEKLEALWEKHPNWNFEFLYTGLKFDQAVYAQYSVHNKNLVPKGSSGEYICSVCGTKEYDSGWYGASQKAIAYYMDSRNFLNENNIFQFLELNEYELSSCSLEGIQSKVNGTFLQNYANDVNNACLNTNVNPYYIITRLLQEQGTKGTKIRTGMDGGDGKTYYNPFNIGASGDGYAQIYANALAKAKSAGWDTMQKGIEGGIYFCKYYYLENYQNTLYLNKFNVDSRNRYALHTHQYMQNLMAAYSESSILRSMYANTGKTDSYFTFIIPVYEDMNVEISGEPSASTETNPINVQVTASSGLNLRDGASSESNVIKTIKKGEIVLSVQRGINTNWHKVMLEDGTIGYMSGQYLQQVDDVTNCSISAYVKTNDGSGCKIRVGPSLKVPEITCLYENTNVTIINKGTYNNIDGYDWVRVLLSDGRQGFMPSKYLREN